MIISTSRNIPQVQQLCQVLKQEFSDQYSYRVFGLGSEKSIIIEESDLVGVQLTSRGTEISIDGTFPSVEISVFYSFFFFILGLFLPWHVERSWRNLEKELAVFLKKKYA